MLSCVQVLILEAVYGRDARNGVILDPRAHVSPRQRI